MDLWRERLVACLVGLIIGMAASLAYFWHEVWP